MLSACRKLRSSESAAITGAARRKDRRAVANLSARIIEIVLIEEMDLVRLSFADDHSLVHGLAFSHVPTTLDAMLTGS
jgi:hypothetical protein